MCGFVGYIELQRAGNKRKQLSDAITSLEHRGPNSKGSAILGHQNNIGFGHTRLSIQDTSLLGSQPMTSQNERFVIAYNGEIYNHLSLRKKMEKEFGGVTWKGSSDTETLLAMFEFYNFEDVLDQIVGMFSFALYDQKLNKIFLVRDRLGEKPLYIFSNESGILFGSELKALECFQTFSKTISMDALGAFFKTNYIPAPLSIYRSTFKCMPGHYLEFNLNNLQSTSCKSFEDFISNNAISFKQYWSSLDQVNNFTKPSFVDSCNTIESLLEKSIERCSISDVPLGAFLSGGIDSSLIIALMQKNSLKKTETFTIGFEDKRFDESSFASKIADHLGTSHHEVILSNKSVLNCVSNIGNIYDEPFADSSQIPTILVSEIASKKVTVALSGDGGDELFGGYNRYLLTERLWKHIKYFPMPVRNILGKMILYLPPRSLQKLEIIFKKFNLSMPTQFYEKIQSSSRWIQDIRSKKDLYFRIVEFYNDISLLLPGYINKNQLSNHLLWENKNLSFVEKMMMADINSYLPDDILCKVDRASMSCSLETRAPFLDVDLVKASLNISLESKICNNQGKYVLRKILSKYVPNELFERPKQGFGVPLSDWISGSLRDSIEKTLLQENQSDILFNKTIIKQMLSEQLENKRNWQHQLWGLYIFQKWAADKDIDFRNQED